MLIFFLRVLVSFMTEDMESHGDRYTIKDKAACSQVKAEASQILKILHEFPVGFLYPPNLHYHSTSPEHFEGSGICTCMVTSYAELRQNALSTLLISTL